MFGEPGHAAVGHAPMEAIARPGVGLVALWDKIADGYTLFARAVELGRVVEAASPRRRAELARAWWVDSAAL
jgi:hypothetical protein